MLEERRARCVEAYNELHENCADYVAEWAKKKPKDIAIIEHNTGDKITWKDFDRSVSAFAAKLLAVGLEKGDIVATSLPLLKEHIYLIYACYRIGVIVAPLDLRLKTKEVQYCMDKMQPKAYFFLGKTPVADFRPLVQEVMKSSPSVKIWVQFQKEEDQIIDGAQGITAFASDIKKIFIKSIFTRSVPRARKKVAKRDPALIIFTTGSTGSPKPALLCHEGILTQNVGLAHMFELNDSEIILVNLPPSHVGCVTEQLATAIYGGTTLVALHIFDAEKSLEAIQEYKVTMIGQIPALFNMQWRLPNYNDYDLSSLKFVMYGGQSVSREFLLKMMEMAPNIATGDGLTESSGFATYTDRYGTVDTILEGIGFDMPLCPLTIREPMNEDGTAGKEKAPGEVGEICFSGPQLFLGYLNDPENTKKTLSKEGILYTGDLGSYDDKGLHFAGRSKLVIKPKGYQVFPTDIEEHITGKLKDRVNMVGVIGAEHNIFTEGIMAFVEVKDGASLTEQEVLDACRDISAYSRPSHVEILKAGELPLNRVAKTDYMELKNRAKELVPKLREQGKWDSD